MDGQPRSIFATLWFRALLVVLVLGAVAAVAVPYVLDVVNPPADGPVLATSPRPTESAPSVTAPPTPRPAPPAEPASPPTPAAAAPAPAEPPAAGTREAERTATAGGSDRPSPPAGSERSTEPRAAEAVAESRATPPPAPARPSPASAENRTAAPKVEAERGGTWWVQVGAFRDAAAARRLAARLREQNYPVQESVKRGAATVAAATTGDTSSDRYDVFVSGLAPAEIQSRLATRGLAADPVAGGAVVKPGLPLREAVALSRELAAEGLKVQVRRQGSAETGPAAPAGAADSLYRVRVGAFADRAAALAVARELETRGYKPFLTRDGS